MTVISSNEFQYSIEILCRRIKLNTINYLSEHRYFNLKK